MFRRTTFFRLFLVRANMVINRGLVGGQVLQQLHLGCRRPLLILSSNSSNRLYRRLRYPFMQTRVEVVRRQINVRSACRTCPIRIRSFKGRLHAGRGVHFPLFGIISSTLMNHANANNVRVRSNRFNFQGGLLSIIFGLFHTGSTIRGFRSSAD